MPFPLHRQLVAIDYYQKTGAETTALAKQIDDMVKAATGASPGLAAAWGTQTAAIVPTRAALVAELQKEVARKVKQAQETAKRTADCDKPAVPTRRHLSTALSMAPSSPLARRIAKGPRSGTKAPPAPSCPVPGQKSKKVVPRAQVKTRPAPATKPKVAKLTPKPKTPARKTAVKRPAVRT